MKQLKLALLSIVLGLASCGGGGSGTPSGTTFVKNQFALTSDTTDPVQIDALDLRFSENTAAFDSLFQ